MDLRMYRMRWARMRKSVRVIAFAAGVCALVMTLGLSFIAPGLAIVSGMITGLGALVWADYQRRGTWEKGASKDVDVLKQAMADVSSRVEEHHVQINLLKELAQRKVKSQSKVKVQAKARTQAKIVQKPKVRPVRQPQPVVLDIAGLVSDSLKRKQVGMFVQPVVTLPQRKTRFYELFARLEGAGGLSVPANDYMGYARSQNVMTRIDGLLLMRSLQVIEGSSHVKKATPFFANVSLQTLQDKAFMGRLLAFLKKHKKDQLPARLIFELRQDDYADMSPVMIELMRGLGQLGCAFSLDHVTHFDLDVALLVKHRVRSVKISAARLIEETNSYVGLLTMQKFIRQLEGNGVAVIADKVETQQQLIALENLNLSYGQGYLFGRPAPQTFYARKKKAA